VFYRPRSWVIEHNILKQSWWKWSPELKIKHYIVPFERTDWWELQAKTPPGLCGKLLRFTITIVWPRLAAHKEKLGHALSLNMRCEVIHDGEIFPNHGILTMPARLGLRRSLAFLLICLQTENVRLFNYLEMNFREYQIYSSSNHSLTVGIRKLQVQWLFCEFANG
jgi:hypothetical protein